MKNAGLPYAIAAAALGFASLVNLALADTVLSRPYDVRYVPSGAVARVAALGHRTLLSDMYWLASVQYMGEPRAKERGSEKMYPLVDLVTDLDPRHGYAYQTGGIVLSAAGRIDESNRILVKGMEKGPPYWTFPFYVSFNYWFYLGDYEKGAEYARIAAARPKASPNISNLAVSLSARSRSPELAIRMLAELLPSAKDETTRARLQDQMNVAVLERDAQALEREVARYEAELRRPLSTLRDLVLAGYVAELPRDPFGGKYVWDPSDRRVHSSVEPFRFPPPEQPHPLEAGLPLRASPEDLRRMPK